MIDLILDSFQLIDIPLAQWVKSGLRWVVDKTINFFPRRCCEACKLAEAFSFSGVVTVPVPLPRGNT